MPEKGERDPMPCLMTMARKEDKDLTAKELKRANKLRRSVMDQAIAEGKTIIKIDDFSWMIEH